MQNAAQRLIGEMQGGAGMHPGGGTPGSSGGRAPSPFAPIRQSPQLTAILQAADNRAGSPLAPHLPSRVESPASSAAASPPPELVAAAPICPTLARIGFRLIPFSFENVKGYSLQRMGAVASSPHFWSKRDRTALQKAPKNDVVRFVQTDIMYHVTTEYQSRRGASRSDSLAKIASQGLLCADDLLLELVQKYEAAYENLQRQCADELRSLQARHAAELKAMQTELIGLRNKYEPKAMAAAGNSDLNDASAAVLNRQRGPPPKEVGTTGSKDSGSSTDRKKRKGLRNEMSIVVNLCGGQVYSLASPFALWTPLKPRLHSTPLSSTLPSNPVHLCFAGPVSSLADQRVREIAWGSRVEH